MAISDYVRDLRALVGTRVLVMPCVTALIRNEQGRLLMARHAGSDLWGTPGGGVDPNESPQDAVVREVREETGLEVVAGRVLGAWGGPEYLVVYGNGDQCSYVLIAFECTLVGGEPRPDGEEILELRWVTPEELEELPLPRWGGHLLPDLFRRLGSGR